MRAVRWLALVVAALTIFRSAEMWTSTVFE